MASIIESIVAKVDRADQNLQDFQLALDAFYKTKPYEVRRKDDTEAGQRVTYISRVDEIPLALMTIAANVIQDLRSPLDHLATQAVRKHRTSPPDKWDVYFPIAKGAAEYEIALAPFVKRVPKFVVDALRATEAYKGGKGHDFWRLHHLNKPDKHALLVAAGSAFGGVDVSGDMRRMMRQLAGEEAAKLVPPLFINPAHKFCPLKVGDEIYAERLEGLRITRSIKGIVRDSVSGILRGDTAMQDEPKFTFHVAFGEPGLIDGQPALVTLKNMANLVRGVVDGFESLLS